MSCVHGYPEGEFCPACGEVPTAYDGGMLVEEHAIDCECFDCDSGPKVDDETQ